MPNPKQTFNLLEISSAVATEAEANTSPLGDALEARVARSAHADGETAVVGVAQSLDGGVPRLVIRGESFPPETTSDCPETVRTRIKPNGYAVTEFVPLPKAGVSPFAASTDWLDTTFPFSEKQSVLEFVQTLREHLGESFGSLQETGKGFRGYPTTFPASKNATRFAKQPGDALTITAHLEAWLARKECELKTSTFVDYKKIVNGVLIPSFGKYALSELTRGAVRQVMANYSAGNKRISNILSVLRSALTDAVEDELIENNPIAGWTYSKNETPKEEDEVNPFTPDEQRLILNMLAGQHRNFVLFAFWTGLRTSELVALDWTDIDFARGIIRVRRAKTQKAKVAETTKTASGRRDIKILAPALDALNAQKPFTFLMGAEVFQNQRTGERWAGDQPIRKTMWEPALRLAGVAYRRPYQTRHTYASMLLSAGENPMWVAQQMGHKDWAMIRRVYGRFMPDASPEAGDIAVRMFGVQKPKQKMA